MDSLGRTFNPKVSSYQRDGWGRDSYISTNNGGFTSSLTKSAVSHINPLRDHAKMNAPRMHGKPAVYRSNGTGRDFYISMDSGGFRNSSSPDTFYKSLRRT
jgi:hypothetical protein